MDDDVEATWPKHYRPLPQGYVVKWVECVEHFMWFGPNDTESVITCDKYAARRGAFAHAEKAPSRGE